MIISHISIQFKMLLPYTKLAKQDKSLHNNTRT